MKDWMKIIPADELKTYQQGGFMGQGELGERTALVVVDVTMGFCGSEGKSLEEAISEFGPACGPVSWETMPRIAGLINLFRELGRPVIYTRSHLADTAYVGKATKSKRVTNTDSRRVQRFPRRHRTEAGRMDSRKDQGQRLLPDPARRLSGAAADRHGDRVRRIHIGLRARFGGRRLLERLQHVCGG